MQFFDPPAMTASYNGWLGFGEDPNTKGTSYNEVRSLIIGEAMQNVKIKMKKLNIEMNEINFEYIKTEFLKEVARLSDKYGVDSNIEYFWKSK